MFAEWSWTTSFFLATYVLLWLVVLVLGFLLLGTLRMVGLLKWRLMQLESTTPSRVGRNGLKPGKKAPDFALPAIDGKEVSLHDFAGRKVLLVFTQSGCGPCHELMPELIAMGGGEVQVVVVNKGDREATRAWAAEAGARFPVLVQQGQDLSRKYEAFATPFAFQIDERGVVASSGIVLNKEHLGYVLSGAGKHLSQAHVEEEPQKGNVAISDSTTTKEVQHV
jgi:methylamine dehydrogenase accessory protein MauD